MKIVFDQCDCEFNGCVIFINFEVVTGFDDTEVVKFKTITKEILTKT